MKVPFEELSLKGGTSLWKLIEVITWVQDDSLLVTVQSVRSAAEGGYSV